jgi:hypothetical protein
MNSVKLRASVAGAVLLAALIPTQVIAATKTATRVSLWKLNETSGATTMKDSIGSNDGTINPGVITGQPGQSGSAYEFTGSSDSYVSVPDAASLHPEGYSFAATVHVNFTTAPATSYDLMRKGLTSNPAGEWSMELIPSPTASGTGASCHFKTAGSPAVRVTGGGGLGDGSWHAITCARTGAEVSLTIDNQVVNQKTISGGSIDNTSPIRLGARYSAGATSDQYVGLMDNVSFATGKPLFVAGLSGSSRRSNTHPNKWVATILVSVKGDTDGSAQGDARVGFHWTTSSGASGTDRCTTGSNGKCSVRHTFGAARRVTFSVHNISKPGFVYDAADNVQTKVSVHKP